MIQVTLTFNTIAEAVAQLAKLDTPAAGFPAISTVDLANQSQTIAATAKALAGNATAVRELPPGVTRGRGVTNPGALPHVGEFYDDFYEVGGVRLWFNGDEPAAYAKAKALAGNATAASSSATSEAAPVPSPRTADPAAPGEAPAVPAATGEKPAAETPTALTAAAPAAGEPFDYRTLAVAVNQRVPKFGKDKLLAIAKKHGAETFKALPPEAWAAAHADVVALGE